MYGEMEWMVKEAIVTYFKVFTWKDGGKPHSIQARIADALDDILDGYLLNSSYMTTVSTCSVLKLCVLHFEKYNNFIL